MLQDGVLRAECLYNGERYLASFGWKSFQSELRKLLGVVCEEIGAESCCDGDRRKSFSCRYFIAMARPGRILDLGAARPL